MTFLLLKFEAYELYVGISLLMWIDMDHKDPCLKDIYINIEREVVHVHLFLRGRPNLLFPILIPSLFCN